jgi:prepilin-type N-terminal cleavage/methylation domain-containing protein
VIGGGRLYERRLRANDSERGFTLPEMVMAIVLSLILGGILLSAVLSSQRSANASTQLTDLTAEARAALNRMSADIEQAVPLTQSNGTVIPAITAAANPDGPTYSRAAVTSVTFNIDANGDGCVAGIASNNLSPVTTPTQPTCSAATTADPNNPETETFCWAPGSSGSGGSQLYLLATSPSNEQTPVTNCGGGTPLLAGKVTGFEVFYQSSLYYYQNASGVDPQAGVTTWYDLDDSGPPVGNDDGVLGLPELKYIDSVVINLTMSENGHTETFQTEVSLRNVHPND